LGITGMAGPARRVSDGILHSQKSPPASDVAVGWVIFQRFSN
jgi:hypothetical protein